MNNTNLLHTLEVTQISPGSPIYEGFCKTCGFPVKVIETWAAAQAVNYAHNSGFKKGILVGGVIGISIVWCLSKLVKEDKDQ